MECIRITPESANYAAIVAAITPITRVHSQAYPKNQIFADFGSRNQRRHENINTLR